MAAFLSEKNFSYSDPQKIGILAANIGTPATPSPHAVRKYLRQFLSDRRVIEVPRLLWFFILNLLILPFRARASAKRYKSIWTPAGSPLLVGCQEIVQSLEAEFSPIKGAKERTNRKAPKDFVFALGMRYGLPSIPQALLKLKEQGCRYLFVLPMYPQYSSASTASVFESVSGELRKWRWIPELRFLNHYHDHPDYIAALADTIREHRQTQPGDSTLLLFSYHGLPLRSLLEGDPYHYQCHTTSRLVAQKLSLNTTEYQVCFQSRLGRQLWLQPYTDVLLKELPSRGIHHIDIISPSFTVDCLETLEEINIENRSLFVKAGGLSFNYIPCLNASPALIGLYKKIIKEHTEAWDTDKGSIFNA